MFYLVKIEYNGVIIKYGESQFAGEFENALMKAREESMEYLKAEQQKIIEELRKTAKKVRRFNKMDYHLRYIAVDYDDLHNFQRNEGKYYRGVVAWRFYWRVVHIRQWKGVPIFTILMYYIGNLKIKKHRILGNVDESDLEDLPEEM